MVLEAVLAWFRVTFMCGDIPREVGSIVADLGKNAQELRERADWEREKQAINETEVLRIREVAEKSEAFLKAKNAELDVTIARADRVADRFEELTK